MKTIVVLSAVLLCAQQSPRILEERPGLRVTLDDDGGRVETFRHGDAPRATEYHGGAVIKAPLVQLVFLGDWSRLDSLKRTLERGVVRDDADVTRAGIVRPAAIAGSRDVAAPKTINDLHVRTALAALPLRDPNAIFVVFVAPSVHATLGGSTDFDSYHSHFHADDGHVRYVVVPFNGDAKAMSDGAARSLARAIVNPDGDGWY
ncbi:MAG TPA: hypothetical protein VG323_19895 [Thermoanaerobaculia bacterium]|nr:hypothetical protein [Thermoanaerobaculia bacterium]